MSADRRAILARRELLIATALATTLAGCDRIDRLMGGSNPLVCLSPVPVPPPKPPPPPTSVPSGAKPTAAPDAPSSEPPDP